MPTIAYGVDDIPCTIVSHSKNPKHSYFQCDISTGEYIIRVLIEVLTGIPIVIIWLLLVYMIEFYLNTLSDQRLTKILIFFKSCTGRKRSTHLPAEVSKDESAVIYVFHVLIP